MTLQNYCIKSGNWLFRYRSYIPVVVLFFGFVMFTRIELHPELSFVKNTRLELPFEILCLAVSLSGLLIRAIIVGYTPRNTSGRNVHTQVADKLNTSGLYSVMRHPLYAANFIIWLGIALLTENLWFIISFMLFYVLYYERIIYAEEQFLHEKFGDEFIRWANLTPAIVPALKRFRAASQRFNWKKVLKKEKSGLMAIFAIFSAYDLLGAIINNFHEFHQFLLLAFIFSLFCYLVIKFLSNYTNFLHEP